MHKGVSSSMEYNSMLINILFNKPGKTKFFILRGIKKGFLQFEGSKHPFTPTLGRLCNKHFLFLSCLECCLLVYPSEGLILPFYDQLHAEQICSLWPLLSFPLTKLVYIVYNTKQHNVYLSICLYLRISLTAEPFGFSLTGQLPIGSGKVYNYFLGGWDTPIPPKN